MTVKSISELLTRYELKQCTPEEEARVEAWLAEHGSEKSDFDQMSPELQQKWVNDLYNDITISSEIKPELPIKRTLWSKLAVAAAILIGIGICLYLMNYKSDQDKLIAYANQIQPAKGSATLTLSNGKVLNLNDAKAGLVIDVAALTYVDGSAVASFDNSIVSTHEKADTRNLVMNTPSGKQYQLILSDGTKVWLNAKSSLKFPSDFSTSESRAVELTGEAYFEVAKDKVHPFIVKSYNQEIQVLGTHFNVNAYQNMAKTTLLEGSVKVLSLDNLNDNLSNSVILKPNEQALNGRNKIVIKPVDADRDIAWKEGWFDFRSASLQDVLSEAANWYDLDISYEGNVPADRFTGKVPRTASLGSFIKLLQLSEVKFRFEGRKMIVI